jgi:tRNA G18 (ribose-2'-O)-methylase SpoU
MEGQTAPLNGRMTAIKYNVHTCFQHHTKERMGEIAHQLALPVHIALLNLDGNMNIAMTVRTAAVLGISDVWILGRRKYDARPEVGAKHYVNVHKVEKIEDPKAFFQGLGLQPVLVEQGGTALEEMNFKPFIRGEKPVCFIMGSESHGIPKEWLEALKDTPRISISQYGLIRSLNVSIAASIVLYEYLKQWREMRREL